MEAEIEEEKRKWKQSQDTLKCGVTVKVESEITDCVLVERRASDRVKPKLTFSVVPVIT